MTKENATTALGTFVEKIGVDYLYHQTGKVLQMPEGEDQLMNTEFVGDPEEIEVESKLM